MKPGSHPDTKMCSFFVTLELHLAHFYYRQTSTFSPWPLTEQRRGSAARSRVRKDQLSPSVSVLCAHMGPHYNALLYYANNIMFHLKATFVHKHLFPNDFCIEIYWMYVDKMSWIYSMCFFHNEPPWSHGASWATATQLLTSIFSFGCCSCSATFYGQFTEDGSLEFTGRRRDPSLQPSESDWTRGFCGEQHRWLIDRERVERWSFVPVFCHPKKPTQEEILKVFWSVCLRLDTFTSYL